MCQEHRRTDGKQNALNMRRTIVGHRNALSFVAHREKAYPRARKLCEKLKE